MAGEAWGRAKKARLAEAGGVVMSARDEGREGVGVSWDGGGDLEGDQFTESDARAESDELEKSVDEFLLFGCRWAIGNKVSGCLRFLRGILKNVVVVWTVWVVVVVLPYTLSPELASDRDDSESRVTGRANVEELSSPYAGGPWLETGRFGSSKVTLCFPGEPSSGTCAICFPLCPNVLSPGSSADSVLESSPDLRMRAAMLSRDACLRGRSSSKVGAVVMISGAAASWVSG